MLGVKQSTARKYLDQLVRMGYLEKTSPGRYKLLEREEAKREEEAAIMRTEVEEVKPKEVEPFYFHYKGTPITLKITSLEQLAAVVKYKLITPEQLAYLIKTGYLQSWIERSLKNNELARELDNISGLPDPELYEQATRIIMSVASI